MKKHETGRIICEKIAALQGQRLREHSPGLVEMSFAWEGKGPELEGRWELTPRNSTGQEESLESNFFQVLLVWVF